MTVVNRPVASDWSLETGFKHKINNSYPHRVYGGGLLHRFHIPLGSDDFDADYVCHGITGFQIYFHTPGDILSPTDSSIHMSYDEDRFFVIKPKLITTAEHLRSYSFTQRKCYFNSDRQLRFFKVYSQNNCELECLANYTLNKCGCVKFSMPSK